jgi:folate-dependent phosphoribosylglycinamide formyltransferase PurN
MGNPGVANAGERTLTNVAPVSMDTSRSGYAVHVVISTADGGREILCGRIHRNKRRW